MLTAHPRVLVLDEPTSALDPTAAEEVLAAITRLVHDLGVTVVLAEHRLERVVQYADRVVHLPGDGTVTDGAPASMFATHHRRAAGRRARPARRLDAAAAVGARRAPRVAAPLRDAIAPRAAGRGSRPVRRPAQPLLRARDVVVRYGDVVAVRDVDLDLAAGEVVALMGRNGAGKSSLLWALQGSGKRQSGLVAGRRQRPEDLSPRRARTLVGLVPQTPADLLYLDTVGEPSSPRPTPSRTAPARSRPASSLDRLAPGIADDMHPRDLSEGQRLALVLAVQLRAAPRVVLLDEPTRGLDYHAKRALVRILHELAAEGHAVVMSTHDVEFVAAAADRVVVMADGEIVADGPDRRRRRRVAAFAPQVAKILAPLPWLTVDQVGVALDRAAS